MNKRGLELPVAFLVVAILAIIVLIFVAFFFLSGSSTFVGKFKSVFQSSTAGMDLNLAIENCKQRCEAARELPEHLRSMSAFCTAGQEIDKDGNGVLGDGERDFKCGGDYLKIPCNVNVDGRLQSICG